MNIYLKSLTLRNFKGIRKLTIPFTHETNIYGQNASGKTTVFDAFTWLLFGKDSSDRKDFNIKTLDENNQPFHKLNHEVEAIVNIDGVDTPIKKIYKEKWVTKRGEETAEFSTHEVDYFFNDVPVQAGEYQEKISLILKESVFKLITNALYFNTSVKWTDRREILLELAGKITNDEILSSLGAGADYDNLLFILQSGKTLEEYKREIASKKKIIKDELKLIPSRIDEVKLGIPETTDYATVEKSIEKTQQEINRVEAAISNKNQAYQQAYDGIREKQNTIHQHKTRQQAIVFEIRQSLSNRSSTTQQNRNVFTNRIQTIEQDISEKRNLLNSTVIKKDNYAQELSVLRGKFAAINKEDLIFKDDEFNCPACKRDLEPGDIAGQKETMTRNFMEDKSRRLGQNREAGLRLKTEVENCEALISSLTAGIEKLGGELNTQQESLSAFEKANQTESPALEDQLAANDEYVQLGSNIIALEAEAGKTPVIDDAELKKDRAELLLKLDSLKAELNDKAVIERANKRIAELEADEKRMSQEIAGFEKTEFLAEDFIKAKMKIITDRIDSHFKYVKFKMFNEQINGGEEPCCETLINGVPFSDANNAARINAGMDIINALCEHYQVWAPVFIDNRESVTDLIPCKSQVVNLVVMAGVKLSVGKPEFENKLAVA